MLFIIGLGIEQSPTLEAIDVLKGCDHIFYESYTSPKIKDDVLETLERNLDKKVETASRELIEDGRKILELARSSPVALVTSGDPMVATTHQELRTRALKAGIQTRVIHGSSILCSLSGELGLHSYSFGKSVTMTKEPMQYTAYLTIYQNLLRGLHTTILLEWDESKSFFLSPQYALQSLVDAEKDMKFGIVSEKTLVLSASELGSKSSRISAEILRDALSKDYGTHPHVLVIPGRLHFTEVESLSALTGREEDFFVDNSERVERTAKRMVSKYSEKTRLALARARSAAKSGGKTNLEPVFENVEAYTDDALRFLNEGKEELAVLSIGYAEGLLDSLRFSGKLEFEW